MTADSLSQFIKQNSSAIAITDAPQLLIKEIQKILNCPPTGIADDPTKKAFAQFKQQLGLEYPLGLGLTTAKALLKIPSLYVNIDIPHLSQRDNQNVPGGTCNITCVAMCLMYYGIMPLSNQQLEDELFKVVARNGWDRHVHDDLAKLFRAYDIDSRFTTEATWESVKEHLRGGNPVIISGKFTKSGHIVVLRGFDETGFYVNDPWGEWFGSGYQNRSGENLHYSYDLCNTVSYGGKKSTWAHFPKSKKRLPPRFENSQEAIPGIELIKKFEGCYLEAYPDPLSGNLPITIGWGCTVKEDGENWKLGDRITQERADSLLISQLLNNYLPVIRNTVPYWKEMTANQQGALLSFAYNLGAHFMTAGNFNSIRSCLKNKDWASVPQVLLKYCNPGTSVTQGLKRRRIAEGRLWQGVEN